MKKLKGYTQLFIIAVCVTVVGYLVWYRGMTIRDVLAYAERNRWKIFFLLMGLYAIKACSGIIPYSGLNLAAAFSFPLWVALLVNLLGTIICFSISYSLGWFTRADRLQEKMNEYPNVARYFTGRDRGQGWLCCMTHMAGISSEVTGILLGLMRMPYITYILSSLLGVVPGMVLVTIAGETKGFANRTFAILYGLNLLFAAIALAVLLIYCKNVHRDNKAEREK